MTTNELKQEALKFDAGFATGRPISLTGFRAHVGDRMTKEQFDTAIGEIAVTLEWAISRHVHVGILTDAELAELVKLHNAYTGEYDYYIAAKMCE